MTRVLAVVVGLVCVAGYSAGVGAADPDPVVVVFLDTGNTGRSLMAEEYAERYLTAHGLSGVEVFSRGTRVDPQRRSPEAGAVAVLFPQGIDPTGHLAEQLTASDVERATVVLAVAEDNKEQACAAFPEFCGKMFLLSTYAGVGDSNVADAFNRPFAAYQKASAQLAALVPKALDRVRSRSAS